MTVGKPLTVKKATSGGYMGVFAPVSYTYLDVYKRQFLLRVSNYYMIQIVSNS